MPGVHFVRNVLLFSLAALIPVLFLYVCLTLGFGSALIGGAGLERFLRQVATNGLPVVFAINNVSFFLFAVAQQRSGHNCDPAYLYCWMSGFGSSYFSRCTILSTLFRWIGSGRSVAVAKPL
jgi:hypothetical protein